MHVRTMKSMLVAVQVTFPTQWCPRSVQSGDWQTRANEG